MLTREQRLNAKWAAEKAMEEARTFLEISNVTDIQARGKVIEMLVILSEYLKYDLLCEHFSAGQQEELIQELMAVVQSEE